MTTETMTVHEALCELKTMDKRIAKALGECKFATTNRHCNQKISGIPIADYCKLQADNYKSVIDLVGRRDAIKRAVVKSNASAIVNVNGEEMTVAEAIDAKNNGIVYLNRIHDVMALQLSAAQTSIDRANGDDLQRRADLFIESTYGKQTDIKNVTEEIRRDREQFLTNHTMDLVQPDGLDVVAEMKRLYDKITTFATKVDAALSVSNATTTIEFSY